MHPSLRLLQTFLILFLVLAGFHLGTNRTKQANLEFSALWHRAYTLVWNDWFRDENLQAPKTISTASGSDATTYELLNRGKKHDYFTSALPWPQKGATGKFRSNATGTLESWHYAQEYASLLLLGDSWIQVTDTNVQRTLAVASEPQFIFDSLFKLRCTRPMPVNSIPGGTHF